MDNQRTGDAYTFIALERDSKLVVAWHLGKRTAASTNEFIAKLRKTTPDTNFQITTDGFTAYPPAMEAGITDHIWNIEELLNAA